MAKSYFINKIFNAGPLILLYYLCISEVDSNLEKYKSQKKGEFIFSFEKNVDNFYLNFWRLSGAEVCQSRRSRQELSNMYLLAKIGADTQENEPLKLWNDFIHLCP